MIVLERRTERSPTMAILSPLIAVALTLVASALLFAILGKDPARGLYLYFVEPLTQGWGLQEIAVKASPLALIACGLALCYRANVWNIGAEGQLTVGAIFGGALGLAYGEEGGAWLLPAMLAAGALGGALWGLIPAFLKVKTGASEILTSLMLVYVAQLLLDWLVRGPLRDPAGYNFPQSATFADNAAMPILFGLGRLHLGFALALLAVGALAFVLARTLSGFAVKAVGEAPRAARFAGFDQGRITLGVFAASGALSGLAGVGEVAGPVGQLLPVISPGYGFTAIIVAFLGRLNPVGILVASLALALSYIGGENAQIAFDLPLDATRVIQGLLLFFTLACDTLVLNRVRRIRHAAAEARA